MQRFLRIGKFDLEAGGNLANLQLEYHAFGSLNEKKDNVVWICHALTANSNVPEWWPDIAGVEGVFNPAEHFIICSNMIGSCYGSTGPLDINPEIGKPYFYNFPLVTIRDIVRSHILLMESLGIDQLYACVGGSCGGHQVLEMGVMLPGKIKYLIPVATCARETAWSIAIHTAQRMAIECDKTWGEAREDAGMEGMKAARGMGLLTYRTFESYIQTQTEEDDDKLEKLKASSYIRYQGLKLANRFNAFTYWHMSKTLDTHHLGRLRKSAKDSLNGLNARTLIVGIDSDILIPPSEQKFLAQHISGAELELIKSPHGHDSFLINQKEIAERIRLFIGQ